MRCAMTGQPVHGSVDAVWDDGEWISWDWINQHIDDGEFIDGAEDHSSEHLSGKIVSEELEEAFEEFVYWASEYKRLTGRYLQIWGELGEFYAEVKWGIERHTAHAQGSDGRLGNDFVEVKTISPEKVTDSVQVKRSGHFNKLLIVRISEGFDFEAKMIDRKQLEKGKGRYARASWSKGEGTSKQ